MIHKQIVSFGKYKGITVGILVSEHPQYCNWLFGVMESKQGSAHVEKLCKAITEVKQMNKAGIGSSGTETGSFGDSSIVGKQYKKKNPPVPEPELKYTTRATTLDKFLDLVGIYTEVEGKPDSMISYPLDSLVVCQIVINPHVKIHYADVAFKVFHRNTGLLLGGS